MNDINNIQNFLDKVTLGVEITAEEKKILYGLYILNYFKACLELLLGLNSNNLEFQIGLVKYLNSAINSLDKESREEYDQVIEFEKSRIMGDIIKSFKENLTAENKQKLEENLKEILPQETTSASTPPPSQEATTPAASAT